MFQESRFDPKVTSWVGAKGLMQVMPRTAQELKIADVVTPDTGILAGTKLLARYSAMFDSPEVLAKDRLRFALASYNCGPGHVADARVLAKDMGLDPNVWFKNVERAALLLSKPEVARKARYGFCRCEEPVKYVSEIQTRYDAYVKMVPPT
jgi:membrane-bound lytic murein transglycosylase F